MRKYGYPWSANASSWRKGWRPLLVLGMVVGLAACTTPEAPKTGEFTVEVTPADASVTLAARNGRGQRAVEVTPRGGDAAELRYQVAAGTYTVVARAEGYEPFEGAYPVESNGSVHLTLTLYEEEAAVQSRGDKTGLTARLTPHDGEVTVTGDGRARRQATAILDDGETVVQEVRFKLDSGSYTVEATAEGRVPERERVEVSRGDVAALAFDLESGDPPSDAGDDGDEGDDEEAPVHEATYYVSTDGSDSSDGTTTDTAFATINQAASVVQPGDLVLIRGGTYHEQVKLTVSGTKSNPITFAGYPGEEVIQDGFAGSYDPDATGRDRVPGWDVAADWNVVRDLTVTNANFVGLYVRGSNNVVRRVTAHGNRYHGILLAGTNHLVEDCVAYDNQQPNGGYRSDRGEVQQSADGVVFNGENITARRCVSYRNADDGFDAWGADDVMIEDSVAFDNGYDNGNGNGFKLSNEPNSVTVVRQSIAFNNLRRGFTNNGGSGHAFYNNTAFNNGSVGFQNYDASSNVLKNNIAFGHEHDYQSWGGSAAQSHNTWNLDMDDPSFQNLDPIDPDFLTLASSSPAIEAGTDVGLTYAGAAPDLGALAYGDSLQSILNTTLSVLASGERKSVLAELVSR